MNALIVLLKVIGCIFIADFLSGFFHWLEDAYGREEFPITGKLITQPNMLHHRDPRYFTRHSWAYSARVLFVMGALALPVAYFCGFLNWMTVLVVLLGVNANEIHKWSHRPPTENGRLISSLQKIGLLQSPTHHSQHHRDPKNSHYCVITNYLNPILDGAGFWLALECLLYLMFGLQRRIDSIPTQVTTA